MEPQEYIDTLPSHRMFELIAGAQQRMVEDYHNKLYECLTTEEIECTHVASTGVKTLHTLCRSEDDPINKVLKLGFTIDDTRLWFELYVSKESGQPYNYESQIRYGNSAIDKHILTAGFWFMKHIDYDTAVHNHMIAQLDRDECRDTIIKCILHIRSQVKHLCL